MTDIMTSQVSQVLIVRRYVCLASDLTFARMQPGCHGLPRHFVLRSGDGGTIAVGWVFHESPPEARQRCAQCLRGARCVCVEAPRRAPESGTAAVGPALARRAGVSLAPGYLSAGDGQGDEGRPALREPLLAEAIRTYMDRAT